MPRPKLSNKPQENMKGDLSWQKCELLQKKRAIIKQGDLEPCNISGSPYSIDKLVSAQGLNAHLGRADHRKRKRCADIVKLRIGGAELVCRLNLWRNGSLYTQRLVASWQGCLAEHESPLHS
jgi:hypothetical protein